jgi:undecaprenyl-diphosphatase
MSAVGDLGRGGAGLLTRAGTQLTAAYERLRRLPRMQVRWPDRNTLVIRAGIAFAIFLIVMVLFDAAAIKAARQLPHWIISVFDWLTDFGKGGWFLWPLAVVMLAITAVSPRVPRIAQLTLASIAARCGFLFLAIALPGVFVNIVKHIIGRARPFVGGAADPYLFRPFSWPAAYASLPSGHAATACGAALAFGMLWPRLRPLMWAYAVVIGISRVVVTAHHPSDVLAGALVGIVGAILVRNYYAARGVVFGVTPNGAPVVFPGPSKRRVKSVARALLAD